MSTVKLLKGFRSPITEEMNTISLLLKSNLDLKEHIKSVRVKLLKALTCILENYGRNYNVYFHHKIVVLCGRNNEYPSTNEYLTSLANLKKNLNSSLNHAIRMTYGKKKSSHFVNIRMESNGKVVELSKREFIELNSKIISAISMINDECLFIDDNEKPIKKAIQSDECLFIDDDEKPIKKAIQSDECLFIDDDEKPIKKAIQSDECLFIDDDD